jgi:ComF family protein
MHRLSHAANDVVRILFEPGCAGCGQLLDAPLQCAICDNCWNHIEPVAAPFCQTCGDELAGAESLTDRCERCTTHPPAFSIARSAGRYDGPLRELIHAFKYEGRRLLAEPLGGILRQAGHDVLVGADAVVPVPLHVIRSISRGFNQADDLARQLKLPVWRALRRRRHGPSQMRLPAAARRRNLESHFSLSTLTWAGEHLGRSLKGTSLVVIDDVMTTGATLEGCARVLREAGAAEVRALTVARTVVARPPRPAVPRHPSPLRH